MSSSPAPETVSERPPEATKEQPPQAAKDQPAEPAKVPPLPTLKEHRRLKRRAAKKGCTVSCRRGLLGVGPDLAIRLVDISEEGARIQIKSALKKGDEVEVSLTAPGLSRPVVRVADVAWCGPAKEGDGFWIGVQFRSLLRYADILHLV
jgi:hypothetical protein